MARNFTQKVATSTMSHQQAADHFLKRFRALAGAA